MTDSVKYQLERAEDALRTALQLGAQTEDPYLLRNISETISAIKTWKASSRFTVTKQTTDQGIKFDFGLDENPYNYINSTAGNDVITFS